jgi:hypothetical protein
VSVHRASLALVLLSVAIAIGVGCSSQQDVGAEADGVTAAARWTLSQEALRVGTTVRVPYEAAPKWTGAAACGGALLDGTRGVGEHLRTAFPQIASVGGYACRQNTADLRQMSVHGTGRALDVFVPTQSSSADTANGDPIADWLVLHASRIGVQLVIWNRTMWRANGTNDVAYKGPNPHVDHIHVEITAEAAKELTPWFADPDGDGDAGAGDASKPDAAKRDAAAWDAGVAVDDAGPDADNDPDPYTPDPTTGDGADAGGDDAGGEPPSTDPPAVGDPEPQPGARESLGEPTRAAAPAPAPAPEDTSGSCSAGPARLSGGGRCGPAPWALVAVGLGLVRRRRSRADASTISTSLARGSRDS